MKALAVLALSCLFVPAAFAQSAAQSTPTSAPPPPGMNDPGVKPAAPALPAMRDDARDARGQTPPEVKVHQEGDNTVQEYVRNGQLYMVVITPRSGPAQTYMVDPQGRLIDEHGKKTVSPVMYKLLEWGKSKPARPAEATTGGE